MKIFTIKMNDPAVAAVKQTKVPALPVPCPSFSVQGFTGNGGRNGSSEHQSAQVYVFIAHTLSFVQKYLNKPITSWSIAKTLICIPKAGRQLNAYYDRHNLRFFYNKHPLTKKVIYTSESSDVVCHELGHAILDAIRPDLWSNPTLEIPAFHESFADCIAILSSLHYDEMIDFLLIQTNGNFRSRNSLESIAEEMGEAVFQLNPNSGRKPGALRFAINDFVYNEPEKLPNVAKDDHLSKSGHSLSRVFTGAFYDSLVNFYEDTVESGIDPKLSLQIAREHMGRVLLNGVSGATLHHKFFNSVARSMISVDLELGNKAHSALVKGFCKKNIVAKPDIPLLYGSSDMKNNTNVPVLCILSQWVEGDNPLYQCQVEVPIKYQLKMADDLTEDEVIKATQAGLDYIVEMDQVCYNKETDQNKEFRVENNKLVRNFFASY